MEKSDQIGSPVEIFGEGVTRGGKKKKKKKKKKFFTMEPRTVKFRMKGKKKDTLMLPIVDLTQEMGEDKKYVICKLPTSFYNKVLKLVQEKINQKKKGKKEFRIKGNWTYDEDAKLLELVKKNGPKKWSFISAGLPGRIGKQCRERWLNHLDPKIRRTEWTDYEDKAVVELHRTHGNHWSQISKSHLLSGRTANMIKNRWNSTLKRKSGGSIRKTKSRRRKKKTPIVKEEIQETKITEPKTLPSDPNSVEDADLKPEYENTYFNEGLGNILDFNGLRSLGDEIMSIDGFFSDKRDEMINFDVGDVDSEVMENFHSSKLTASEDMTGKNEKENDQTTFVNVPEVPIFGTGTFSPSRMNLFENIDEYGLFGELSMDNLTMNANSCNSDF